MDGGARWATVHGVSKSRTRLSDFTFMICRVPLVAQMVENPPAVWETWAQSLGWEDPLEKGTVTYSSILAWRIPGTIQSTGLQRVGHKKSRTRLSDFHFF